MADSFVIKAKVKEYLKDVKISSDFYEALDGEIKVLLDKAKARMEANGRKTLMAKDL